jgi:hypothetical protein
MKVHQQPVTVEEMGKRWGNMRRIDSGDKDESVE